MNPKSFTLLGLESSCDDTAAAVVRGDAGGAQVVSSVVYGQTDLHAAFGGVVPEIAARAHAERRVVRVGEDEVMHKVSQRDAQLVQEAWRMDLCV